MSSPTEITVLRRTLFQLVRLCERAETRAAEFPRVGEEAWRGPAHRAYSRRATELESECRVFANGVGAARDIAQLALVREEVWNALR